MTQSNRTHRHGPLSAAGVTHPRAPIAAALEGAGRRALGLIRHARYRPPALESLEFYQHYVEPLTVVIQDEDYETHYLDVGPRSDTAVLCLHGLGAISGQFAGIMRTLASHHALRVVAPDLPGHGLSAGFNNPACYRIYDLCAWLASVVCQLAERTEAKRIFLVCHSFSSAIAVTYLNACLKLCARPPSALAGACIVSFPAGRRIPGHLVPALLPWANRLLPGALLRLGLGGPYYSDYISAITADRSRRSQVLSLVYPRRVETVRAQVEIVRRNAWLLAQPQEILVSACHQSSSVPIRLLHGSDDRLFPCAYARALLGRHYPEARFTSVAGAGHNVLDDAPDVVVNEVLQLIQEDGE